MSEISELFSRFASSYERVNGILSLGLDAGWRVRAVQAIEHGARLRILDLCAGTLGCTRAALARFPDARVTAVDFCRPMLDAGLARLAAPCGGRVEIVCADALRVSFPRASFDAVICSMGMRHLPEQGEMLARIRTWLSPGGQFIVLDFFRPERLLARMFHATAGRFVLPLAGSLFGGYGDAYRKLYDSIECFMTRRAYEDVLGAHGFEVQRARDFTCGIISLIETRSPA